MTRCVKRSGLVSRPQAPRDRQLVDRTGTVVDDLIYNSCALKQWNSQQGQICKTMKAVWDASKRVNGEDTYATLKCKWLLCPKKRNAALKRTATHKHFLDCLSPCLLTVIKLQWTLLQINIPTCVSFSKRRTATEQTEHSFRTLEAAPQSLLSIKRCSVGLKWWKADASSFVHPWAASTSAQRISFRSELTVSAASLQKKEVQC